MHQKPRSAVHRGALISLEHLAVIVAACSSHGPVHPAGLTKRCAAIRALPVQIIGDPVTHTLTTPMRRRGRWIIEPWISFKACGLLLRWSIQEVS